MDLPFQTSDMDLLFQTPGDIPFSSPVPPVSAPGQRKSKRQEAALTKEAFNRRVRDLKGRFNSEVDKIALEFSRQGLHRSCRQIRKQVLFTMSQPVTTRKPTVYNAWLHAESLAEKLESTCIPNFNVKASRLTPWAADAFPSLPYSDEYINLLKDIKSKTIAYEDVKGETPEEEHHQSLLFQGLLVKRDERGTKKSLISPELSLHRMSKHIQEEIIALVSVRVGLII